jgi:hypothetical protein
MSRVSADKPTTINLHTIDGDDWQFICVLGPYSDPKKVMRAEATRRKLAVTSIDLVPAQTQLKKRRAQSRFLNGPAKSVIPIGTNCYSRDVGEIALPAE